MFNRYKYQQCKCACHIAENITDERFTITYTCICDCKPSEKLLKLQEENGKLNAEIEQLKAQLQDSLAVRCEVSGVKLDGHALEINADEILNRLADRVGVLERRLDSFNEKQASQESTCECICHTVDIQQLSKKGIDFLGCDCCVPRVKEQLEAARKEFALVRPKVKYTTIRTEVIKC